MEWLQDHVIFGNSLSRWAIAMGTGLAIVSVLAIAKRVVITRIRKRPGDGPTAHDGVLAKVLDDTRPITFLAAGIAGGIRTLSLPDDAAVWIGRGLFAVLAFQAGLWTMRAVRIAFAAQGAKTGELPGHATMRAAIDFLARLIVWSIVLLSILSNVGIEVSTLIAGLGIGGLAAALAVQNVLTELVAAFSLYADRPFDIGDFVIVDEFMGNVERITWRSTYLRSLGGETIVFANSDLSKARIRNYKRMRERRIVLAFGVEYSTPSETLARVPAMVKEEVERLDKTRFERSHFTGFGDSALNFETVYYVLSPDYNEHMDRQQAILLALHRRFGEEGIGFAFPTRTIHVHHHGDAVTDEMRESVLGGD